MFYHCNSQAFIYFFKTLTNITWICPQLKDEKRCYTNKKKFTHHYE